MLEEVLVSFQASGQDMPTTLQLDEVDKILQDFQRVMCADKYSFTRTWDEYKCFAQHRLDDSHTCIADLDPRIWRGDFHYKDRRVDGYRSWNEMVSDYFQRLDLKGGKPWDIMDYMATTYPTKHAVKPQDAFCIACTVGLDSELATSSGLKVRSEMISQEGVTRGVGNVWINILPVLNLC